MARAPLEEPEGLAYRRELLTVAQERNVLDLLEVSTRSSCTASPRGAPRATTGWDTKELCYSITFRTLRQRATA
jgi:hypothetical protein